MGSLLAWKRRYREAVRVHVNANGRVPLSTTGPIDVHVEGKIDATIANPILEVNGRRVKGQISLDVAVSGTVAAPRIDGSARIAQGEIQDYTLGAHLTGVEALIQAADDSLRIASFTAQAGSGTVSASGTVGLLAAGRPVDLKLTARNARALASDLLTADTDLDLTLRGQAATRLDVTGKIRINRADINIPERSAPYRRRARCAAARAEGAAASLHARDGHRAGFDREWTTADIRARTRSGRGSRRRTARRRHHRRAANQRWFRDAARHIRPGRHVAQVHVGQGELQWDGTHAEDRSHARLRGGKHLGRHHCDTRR